jgi:hypothetical protein
MQGTINMAAAQTNWQAAVQGIQAAAQGLQATAQEVALMPNVPQANDMQQVMQMLQQLQPLVGQVQQLQEQVQQLQPLVGQVQQLQGQVQQLQGQVRIDSHNQRARLYNSHVAMNSPLQKLWDAVDHVPANFANTAQDLPLMHASIVTGMLHAYLQDVDANSTPKALRDQLGMFLGCRFA